MWNNYSNEKNSNKFHRAFLEISLTLFSKKKKKRKDAFGNVERSARADGYHRYYLRRATSTAEGKRTSIGFNGVAHRK